MAAVAFILVQFMPWGGVSGSVFGATFSGDAYTWHMEASGSGFGASGSDKTSWYDDEADDDAEDTEHIANIRIAIPLLLGALVLLAVGALLAFVTRGAAAGALMLVGAVAGTIGTILFAIAVDGLFDSDQDWGAAFFLAIGGSALGLASGVLGLAPKGR